MFPRPFSNSLPYSIFSNACPGQVCGTLAGQAVSTLLAASPECAQQDLADEIISQSKQFDAATQAAMLAAAIEFRQAEKNTPPDFTTQPPTLRNSVFCQKAPANAELNGLVQAQDPANDPNIFFDRAYPNPPIYLSRSDVSTSRHQVERSSRNSGQHSTLRRRSRRCRTCVSTHAAPFLNQGLTINASASPVVAAPATDNGQYLPIGSVVVSQTVNALPAATPANCPAPAVVTVTVDAPAATAAPVNVAPAAPPANVDNGAGGANLQAFAGALGGVVAPTVVNLGQGDRPFQVTGNAAFNNLQSALVRSCDVQNNQCANAANGSGNEVRWFIIRSI
jgi:hypothetical protein